MAKFNKITIIGVGLIGGSIGLAIKKRRLAGEVVGVFRRPATLKKALRHRAVDTATMSIEDGVKDADLIIVATPVCSIPAIVRRVARRAKAGAVITDVGSTKQWIVSAIERSLGHTMRAFFVGSHPMAGSECAGVEFARSDLFIGSPCIVTRTKKTDAKALAKVTDLWKALGGAVTVMDPASHDKSVSLVSHLPHIVAFALAGTVPARELVYAAEGFRDTTRVASSDPQLWAEIFLSNRKELLRSVAMFEKSLTRITKVLSGGRRKGLTRLLEQAKSRRDRCTYGG